MNIEQAKAALSHYYGYSSFRPVQESIIRAALEGRDSLVLMPTGGGKSLCFQIPAVIRPGIGIVVSPLIALMKDQVEGLRAMGIRAEFLNSSRNPAENKQVEDAALDGKLDLLYVSPEKLLSMDFSNLLGHLKPSIFAIDEAHCISQWGHDFRPEYTQMKMLKERFPNVPVMALTATADRLTRRDILDYLGLVDPEVFISSFDRPNLSLSVEPGQNRYKRILDFVKKRPGQSGIVYCLSRKSTEEIAEKLKKDGISAVCYHAGLSPMDRSRAQEKFIRDDVQVVCATIAFGMGIDKPNVRWVIHHNLPKNIESYYQEIGRSGRDGLPAETLLLYTFADVGMLQDFISESGQKEVLQTKLDRMVQYADTQECRRRVLLSYFSEQLPEDCGNCDNCKNPSERTEGTVIAQKALSAIMRTDQAVGAHMLVDILRGSQRGELLAKGYQEIKTYGAGADISRADWLHYVMQLLNQGLVEMAYEEGNTLKLTAAGNDVLFGRRKVDLVKPRIATSQGASVKPAKEVDRLSERLFQKLRQHRKEIADSQGVPPYIVFGDNTLKEMSEMMPISAGRMRAVSGVGDRKFDLYGETFISLILDFVQENGIRTPGQDAARTTRTTRTKDEKKQREKGDSFRVTYELYAQGLSVEEIARAREMATSTIWGHLATGYRNDSIKLDLYSIVSPDELGDIVRVADGLDAAGLRAIFDGCEGKYSFEKIRFALEYRLKRAKSLSKN